MCQVGFRAKQGFWRTQVFVLSIFVNTFLSEGLWQLMGIQVTEVLTPTLEESVVWPETQMWKPVVWTV